MLQAYLPLLILFVFAVLIGFLVVAIGHVFGPKRPTARKAAPYESGMFRVQGDTMTVQTMTGAVYTQYFRIDATGSVFTITNAQTGMTFVYQRMQ